MLHEKNDIKNYHKKVKCAQIVNIYKQKLTIAVLLSINKYIASTTDSVLLCTVMKDEGHPNLGTRVAKLVWNFPLESTS